MSIEEIVLEEITGFVDGATLVVIGKVRIEDNIRNNLGIDSLEEIEIIMNLERRLKIAVPDAKAERIKTVGDVVKLIEECVKKAV